MRRARGADVLVHEALWVPAVDWLAGLTPNATTLRKHIIDSHTPVEEVGEVAAAAGVKTLVPSHLVPADGVADQTWIDLARVHFSQIIVGKDLMEI